MFDTGRFVVVEREKLDDVMQEQDLATSGRAAKSKLPGTGAPHDTLEPVR